MTPDRQSARDALRDAIADEESRLATLTAQQAESRRRLTALKAELAALDSRRGIHVQLPKAPALPTPQTSADKVRLFPRHDLASASR